MTVWECEIGFVGESPVNANPMLALAGMTRYIKRSFAKLVGKQADFYFIEVNGQLTDMQREVAEVGNQKLTVLHCKIGVKDNVELPEGADYPMRQNVAALFSCLFRKDAEFNFSGWGGRLSEAELITLK